MRRFLEKLKPLPGRGLGLLRSIASATEREDFTNQTLYPVPKATQWYN